MAIFSNQRYELRHMVSRMCGDLILGVVSSPASGTFVCATRDWVKPDDYFNEWIEMFCYSGTGIGTSGNPYDWDGTGGGTYTLTFKPAATLTAGDLVEMHQRFTVDEYNQAINLAIEMVASRALLNKVDESVELDTNTYQYEISTQFLYIHKIEMESSTSGVYPTYKPIDPKYWRVLRASTIELEFVKDYWSPTDGRHLRITGLASPSKLDTDTEACPVNPVYVVHQAAALLHQSRIRSSGVDSEWHSEQMKLCQAMADKVKDEDPTFNVSIGGAIPVVES